MSYLAQLVHSAWLQTDVVDDLAAARSQLVQSLDRQIAQVETALNDGVFIDMVRAWLRCETDDIALPVDRFYWEHSTFSTLAFFDGPQEARASKYDGLRAFVRAGIGKHRLLMMGNGDQQSHSFCPPVTLAGHQYPILEMSIFGASLVADLDPAQKGLAEMIHQLQTCKITNWTVLPPEPTDRSSIRLCGAQKT